MAVHPLLFYGLFSLLVATNIAAGVGVLMAPDIAQLLAGRDDSALEAYEDRIAQLRVEVDRLHSRQYAQAGDLNLQIQELAQQQELLAEQHGYVKALSDRAAELGLDVARMDDAPVAKGSASLAHTPAGDISTTADALDRMMDETRLALVALSEAATQSTDQIVGELAAIGIRPQLPGAEDAMGGPFIAAADGPEAQSMMVDANEVMAAFSRFKAARGALDAAPVHMPIDSQKRISSNYGNRKDPFTGRAAFHAGIDFPRPTGTTVLSAGAGKVSFVGQRSGYGNVVEVTHGGGLVTRYAHLSGFLVKEGQQVETGSPIAKVGSTGRSTGPHLHFEVRRNDKPLNPMQFIMAGKNLRRYIAGA